MKQFVTLDAGLADAFGAKCLNGAAPTFEMTLNASSTNWVLFLEGGQRRHGCRVPAASRPHVPLLTGATSPPLVAAPSPFVRRRWLVLRRDRERHAAQLRRPGWIRLAAKVGPALCVGGRARSDDARRTGPHAQWG